MNGSVVFAVANGFTAKASAEARVVIRSRGARNAAGLVGTMKDTPPLAALNSEGFRVRARCSSLVVYDVMGIAFASMDS